MHSEEIVVSVVIPAFNACKYISELLNCFLKQTYDKWELLIVDDGSTDTTKEIICSYCEKEQRISLLERDRSPKGAQTCRNIGIEAAQGKYIIIIDADDLIEPYFLEQRVEFMETNPEIEYSTFKGMSVYESASGTLLEGKYWGEYTEDDLLSRFLSVKYPFGIWNNIYRSYIPKKIRFDERIEVYQDFDFAVRTILAGYSHTFDVNSNVDYLYRQGHTGTITSNFINDRKYESTKYLFKKTMSQLLELLDDESFQGYKKDFFAFYLLQFQRVLLNGTDNQKNDYKSFIQEEYEGKYAVKINLAWNILKKVNTQKAYYKKCVYVIIGILFCPMEFIKMVCNRIKEECSK